MATSAHLQQIIAQKTRECNSWRRFKWPKTLFMTQNPSFGAEPPTTCAVTVSTLSPAFVHTNDEKNVLRLFFSLWFYMLRFGPVKKDFPLHSCFRGAPRRYSLLWRFFLKISTDRQNQKNKSEKFGGFTVDSKKNFYDKLTCSFCAHKAEQQNSANIQIDWKKFRLEAARVKPFN